MGLFKKVDQHAGWLAIRFLPEGVRLAHVARPASGKPKVWRCEFQRLPEPNVEALEKFRKEARLDQFRCTNLLGSDEYQMLLVEAPSVPPAELKAAIRWRIKDLLNYHIDDAMVDVLDIPVEKNAPSRSHSMYAVAARNETIQKRVSLFEEAKIPLSVIDIPEMAQRNVAALFEPAGRAVAVLSFDHECGLLTFTHNGELYLARRIEVTAGQLQDADEGLRQQHFERVALELQRSLDHFDRQFHYLALSKLLLAPLPASVDLQKYLADNLYVPVENMNLGDVLDLSRVPDLDEAESQAQYFRVLGAALRNEEKAL